MIPFMLRPGRADFIEGAVQRPVPAGSCGVRVAHRGVLVEPEDLGEKPGVRCRYGGLHGRCDAAGFRPVRCEAELDPVDEALAVSLLEQGDVEARALGLSRDIDDHEL